MTIATGTKLGRYEIRSKLGAGGMGEVYLAEDRHLDRKVALKLLPAAVMQDENRIRRFIQEAKAASALNHPNIVTIHEIAEVDGKHFIATEFIDGQTLRTRLTGKRLTLPAALEMAVQMSSAVVAAHEAGIVHRDIKPENVMLRRDGIVKVLDFGLAKLTEQQFNEVDNEAPTIAQVKTEPGTVMGTANYMSPEQARGQKVDARSDVFSLGVVLYEMLAGKPPFEGINALDVIGEILKSEPQPLQVYAAEVPSELQRIVSKALRKNRDERYQTARDLLNDLKDFKEEISFAAKRARSGQAERNEAVTVSAAANSTASAEQIPSAKILFREIKRHKVGIGLAVALLLLTAVVGVYFLSSSEPSSGAINSIAVLPLVNAGNNPETEYLSDGISESLINSLTKLQQLRVTARSTAFRYKGKDVDPQQVGRDLNVRAVLMGQVRQTGDRLTVQVDLVDASTGAQLWGEEYERKFSDVVVVKQAIAREVTERLRLRLSGEQQEQLVKGDTANPEAYQFYLRGRYYWNKRFADGLQKAIAEFQQAIERDPNYALGYVGLADCYALLEQYAGIPSESLPKAKWNAERALQLDESLAEAHASLANIHTTLWQWDEAEKGFRRAIELNPRYPSAHHWYSMYLGATGRIDEALAEANLALELDPLSMVINGNVAYFYLVKGNLEAASERARKMIELDSSFPSAHLYLGMAYLKQGRRNEGFAEMQKGLELSGRSSEFLGYLGYAHAASGDRADAVAILQELERRYAARAAVGAHLAMVHAGLGNKDQAFAWLEKDLQAPGSHLSSSDIQTLPAFESLRHDRCYLDLVRRMGLQL